MALASHGVGSSATPPQNLEAERALLGAMLLRNDNIATILEQIPPRARQPFYIRGEARVTHRERRDEDVPLFANPANQEIFEVVVAMHDRMEMIDLTTLGHELDRLGRYEAVGGGPYLATLEDEFTAEVFIPGYVRIVADAWQLRTLDHAVDAIKRALQSGPADVETVIDDAQRRIYQIAEQVETKDFQDIGAIAAEEIMEIEARFKRDDSAGLSTGFTQLDRILAGGFREANLIIIAARPSVGKSAFALNIATEVAVKQNKPVGIFSLEMSDRELTQRLLCTLGGISLSDVRRNKIQRSDIDHLHVQTRLLNLAPLHIDDSTSLTILEMRSKARRLKARCPELSMIIIDYLQLMRSTGGRVESRQQEVSEISRSLKGLARELNIPIVALSQLSRQAEQRQGRGNKDRMPKLSDLRESGAIEQDADVVILLHREMVKGMDPNANPREPTLATVRVAKQRNGPRGDFELLFRGHVTQFVDVHRGALGAKPPGGGAPF